MIKSLRLTKSVFQYGKRFFFAKLTLIFLLSAVAFAFASCTHFSKNNSNRTALTLAQKLSILDLQKGFDGWLGFDINQFPILIMDRVSLITHHIQNGKVSLISNDELPKESMQTTLDFDVTSFRGQEALILFYESKKENLDDSFDINLLYFALHEGFHIFYQKNKQVFQLQPANQSRGDFYPILEQPRYFRYEMFRSLTRYLETGDARALNAYSWWYFKWFKNHKEEVLSYTDRIEGSAQYYSNQALTKIYNRENQTQLTPFQHFKKVLMKGGDKYKWFALDKEAYLLGPLTGLILDKLPNKDWKKQVNLKDSPLFVLAQRYKPHKQPVDFKLKEEYLLMSVKRMQEIDQNGVLDKTVSSLATPSTVRLVLANGPEIKMSSFTTNGIYRSFFEFKDSKGIVIIPLTSHVQINTPNLEIKQSPESALILSQKNPCSPKDGGTLFLFPPEKVQIRERQVKTLVAPFINYKAQNILQRSGITWVCLN